ncbi:MAG: 30S ribosomal protein S17 [Legionellales bacterium]|nr:30S ribosomal protein S17 [Legionellales bacterium]|tara:strand:+ start:4770 stop:5042 length:273 start_codon:yes stop_codon:yes gene_type:complete
MSEQTETKQSNRRVLVGTVVSDKMDKSIVVEVVRQVRHKLYKKYIKRAKKFHAHDETNQCGQGDTVKIEECRPLSKTKSWMLKEIIEKAK